MRMTRPRLAVTALIALLASAAAAAHAADVPPVIYDANDNPIPPVAAPAAAPIVRTPRTNSSRFSVALVAPPLVAPKTDVDATVRASVNTLKASAAALTRDGDRLFLGLHDGGMAFCDTDGTHGMVVRFAAPTLPVRAVAASKGLVCWLSGDGATIYLFRESEHSVTSYAVGAPTAGWVQRIAFLGGTLCLCGDRAARVLDLPSGALRPPTAEDGLPAESLQPDGAEALYISGGDAPLVASIGDPTTDGVGVRVWRYTAARRNGQWHEINTSGSDSSAPTAQLTRLRRPANRFAALPNLDVEGAGCGFVGPSGLHLILPESTNSGDSADTARVADIPFSTEPGVPTTVDRLCVGTFGAWWTSRGVLFHVTGDGLYRAAYLPWNSAKGAQIQALLPDGKSVYVALDRGGVRHITPGDPSDNDGYGGYVLARLGDESCQPAPGPETDVATAIEDWQGVPYLWGGQTKSGTDCSGFVGAMHRTVGIAIPRSTAEMKASSVGTHILSELKYGDVLVYPGHCALYIGDGRTAETVASQVSKASIWRRTDVVVKRYLP